MKLLVAFGSTEGQTRKIASHIESLAGKAGHDCTLYDCENKNDPPDVASVDAIFVAASVHQKKHQDAVSEFVTANLADLRSKPSAFISVSLAITMEDGREEAEGYVTAFSADTGWKPEHIHLAGGAIRHLEYDFFKELTIKQIVYKGREMPDTAGANPEYTDWDALDAFVASVLENAGA